MITWTILTTAVVIALAAVQIPCVLSEKCGRNNMDACCEADSICPSGYYKHPNCLTTPSMASLTTTQMASGMSTTTSNSSTVNGSTPSFSSESGTTTTQESTTGSSPGSSTEEAADNTTRTGTDTVMLDHVISCAKCTSPEDCPTAPSTPSFPVAAVAGGVVGGVAFVVVVVVVVAFFVRRRRRSRSDSPGSAMEGVIAQREETKSNVDSDDVIEASKFAEPEYANMAIRPGNLSVNIQQRQDKIFRYVKDPTDHTTTIQEDTVYVNQMSISVKKSEDEHEEIAALGEAPAPPAPPEHHAPRADTPPASTPHASTPARPGKEVSRDKQSRVEEAGSATMQSEEEVYYNTEAETAAIGGVEHSKEETEVTFKDNTYEADYNNEEQIYYNEDADSGPIYMNYGFQKDQ